MSDDLADDPIGAALAADAEAARMEIRAAGIVCPSCGVNMADLPEDHLLTLGHGRQREDAPAEAPAAKCVHGALVVLATSSPMTDAEYQRVQAAANVALYDDFRKNLAEVFAQMLGDQP